MAVSSGPDIVDSGLVLALDAADRNSFDDDENLALNSEAINSWPNNGSAISISANSQIAPDGTLTADVLSQTAVTGASRWVSSMTRTYTAGVTYTLSIWLKKISGTDAQPTINLWVNGGTNQSVGAITTEWVRYSKSFTPASTISSSTFTGLNTGWSDTGVANNFTFAAWGFQVETSSSASPYYPTTSTAKNRGSTLIDLTGRGNNGTLTNSPTYNSSNGGSIVFDGVDDYVNCGTPSIGTGKITVNAWVKINAGSLFQHIVDSASNAWHLAILSDNRPYFWNGSVYHQSAPILTVGQWYMLTGVQGATLDIYINGVLGQSIATNVNVATNSVNLGRYQSASRQLNGNIAQVSIYNRALSATEIQQNFNATRSRFGI